MYASIYPGKCWYVVLRVEIYVCIHTCMYVCVCVFIYIHMQKAVDILCCALRYMCVYTHTYLYAYIYVYICSIYSYIWRENKRAMPQGLEAHCRRWKWNSFTTCFKLRKLFYILAYFVFRRIDGSRRAVRSCISLSAQLDETHSCIFCFSMRSSCCALLARHSLFFIVLVIDVCPCVYMCIYAGSCVMDASTWMNRVTQFMDSACIYMYVRLNIYGVAMSSRLLKIIGLSRKKAL